MPYPGFYIAGFFFVDFFYAAFVALILAFLFVVVFRRSGPWESFGLFFVVLFLLAWAGGVWLVPLGPVLWGSPFLGFVIVGAVAALLLGAIPPARPAEPPRSEPGGAVPDPAARPVISLLLWIFLLVVVISIAVNYAVIG